MVNKQNSSHIYTALKIMKEFATYRVYEACFRDAKNNYT
jgi:hypothetical protein